MQLRIRPMRRVACLGLLLSVSTVAPLPVDAAGDDAAGSDAAAAIEAFQAEYEVARDAMRARLDEVRQTDEYREAYDARDFARVRTLTGKITDSVMQKWRAEAETFAGQFSAPADEIAVAAMRLRLALTDQPIELYESIIEEHHAHPALPPILEAGRRFHRRLGAERYSALMARVIDENPSDEARAWAYFCRGSAFLALRDDEGARERGLADYDRVVELADPESSLSMRARGPKFAEARLQIGMKAPDIVGVDLFGEEFKLSDYAGKVIMLDFWGDW